jgi:SAM-dependent methyltransferase
MRSGIDLQEAENERKLAQEAVMRSTAGFLKSLDLISESYLAQVLLALWDSGLYEYVRHHDSFEIETAARDLHLDAGILKELIEYLVGRSLMEPVGTAGIRLTARGRPYWNYVTRGALTSHLGGYNPMLTHLGPLLRKEISLEDPKLARLGRLVAVGAGFTLLGTGMIPWVLEVIKGIGGQFIMDLGCGAGDFLIQLALRWPNGRGIGIDMSPEAIAEANRKAESNGVAQRIAFHAAALSAEPMRINRETLDRIDVVTSMFVLHEFGGHGGPDAIAEVIAALHTQLPGRKLLMLEGTRADPFKMNKARARTYSQLDYSFIHPLSRQGPLRTPEEWEAIIQKAGGRLVDRIGGFNLIPSWISLFVVQL